MATGQITAGDGSGTEFTYDGDPGHFPLSLSEYYHIRRAPSRSRTYTTPTTTPVSGVRWTQPRVREQDLTSKTDRKGQTITYLYDALNRLTSKNYPDTTAVGYLYGLVGTIQQVNDPTGTHVIAYDTLTDWSGIIRP